jgi:hypothetical protein
MRVNEELERSEIEEREISRYPDERIIDIPTDYLDVVDDYVGNDSDGSERLSRALSLEEDRREREEIRLNEVPSPEDLFKIRKYADERRLYEERSRRRMTDEEEQKHPYVIDMDEAHLQQQSSDELKIRRSHQFMEHLDTDYQNDFLILKASPQIKIEGDQGLFISVGDSEVTGIKYRTDGIMEHEAVRRLEDLAREAAETQRKLEEEPERIGGFGDMTFFSLTKLYADLKEACGEDVDKAELIGYDIDDMEEHTEHLMEKSGEALNTLDKIGVTYFELEGFPTEEVASLVEHLSVRDGFEVEKISTYTDTDMNSEEWKQYHEKRIREDTDEDNALRLFLDDED